MFVLDLERFILAYLVKNKTMPPQATTAMFEFVVNAAYTAYLQGANGQPFQMVSNIPVKEVQPDSGLIIQ